LTSSATSTDVLYPIPHWRVLWQEEWEFCFLLCCLWAVVEAKSHVRVDETGVGGFPLFSVCPCMEWKQSPSPGSSGNGSLLGEAI
jgi:hypothetical protein